MKRVPFLVTALAGIVVAALGRSKCRRRGHHPIYFINDFYTGGPLQDVFVEGAKSAEVRSSGPFRCKQSREVEQASILKRSGNNSRFLKSGPNPSALSQRGVHSASRLASSWRLSVSGPTHRTARTPSWTLHLRTSSPTESITLMCVDPGPTPGNPVSKPCGALDGSKTSSPRDG